MAKQCCVCGRNIGFTDDSRKISSTNELVCMKCNNLLADFSGKLWKAERLEELASIKAEADNYIDTLTDINDDKLHLLLNEKYNECKGNLETTISERKAPPGQSFNEPEQEPDPYYELSKQLLLTTANNLEGYHVVKQLGVVFGETVFKPSFEQAMTSAVGDFFRSFSFSAKEMKGSVELIEFARRFAYAKMMKEALDKGANAIIAIETDNTIGSSTMYLSLYGTAVFVEKD